MPFCSATDVQFIDGHYWVLTQDLCYDDKDLGRIIVPKGFQTDFASIPRIFWNILPPTGKWGPAAVVHDYGYQTQTLRRDQVDSLLLHGMEDLGVGWFARHLIYRAVRLFGGSYWNKDKP